MLIDLGLLLSRLLVSSVFLIAGISKIKMPSDQFLKSILGYDLLSEPLANIVARVLPWLEVFVGGLLIVGAGHQIAAAIGIALLFVFSSAVAISLLRGKENACGCFGALTPVQWRLIYRNLGLMGLCLIIFTVNSDRWSIDRLIGLQATDELRRLGLIVLATIWILMLSMTLLLQVLTRRNPPIHKSSL